MINVEVNKNRGENATNLLRRFSRRVKGSGVVREVRGRRYRQRDRSPYQKKQYKLEKLSRRQRYERLKKLGKLPQ